MPQPSTWSNLPLEHKVQRSTSYREGCGELGSWRGRESQITLCVSRAGPCPGLPPAAREVLVSEWVSVVSMSLIVRKSGFTCLLCHLTKFTYSSYSLVISFLMCWIEVIILATFLGYWEDRIKHLEEKIFVNGKILFDLKPLEGFFWEYICIYTYKHIHAGVFFLPSTYGFGSQTVNFEVEL